MDRSGSDRYLSLEKLFIVIASTIYLIVFNVTVPHGDALRIARQIESNDLIWNPNHLLFDVFGYYWSHFLQLLNTDISILNGFEIISGISTIISLLLFHKILLLLDVNKASLRLVAITGLFASKNFLSMAISQYFFMLQMPFLLGAMLYAVKYYQQRDLNSSPDIPLYLMGLYLAIATGIEINNVIAIIFIGILIFIYPNSSAQRSLQPLIRFWGSAAALGFPVFLTGYFMSGTDSGFLSWVLAYQGESNSSLDQFYGIQWTLTGIVSAGATTVFNLFFGNFIETAGLGTVLKVLVLGLPLEFNPEYTKIILAALLMPLVGLGLFLLLISSVRKIHKNFLIALLLVWTLSYLVFNFFWTFGVDLFWFQLLPALWLLLVLHLTRSADSTAAAAQGTASGWKFYTMTFCALALLVLNTLQTVVPVSTDKVSTYRTQHAAMLQNGDMEIVPGWDRYKWMMETGQDKTINKLLLMNMALQSAENEHHIKHLPGIIEHHLASGKRVIVGRLYDLDKESNPWYGLADLGWPRARIQQALSEFCRKPLETIDDVVFYELFVCNTERLSAIPK